ncbi:MAG: lamin tail domain-containing protein, partial [Planctomycetota bacterium]
MRGQYRKIALIIISITALSTNMSDASNLAADRNQANLVINEVMASNSSTIQDPQGQYDDWIEIYNFGSEAVNIGGMYLTDNLTDPTKWQIPTNNPSDTTIPAHGYLLIWADKDTTDTGLHANFKLDAMGEELGLFDTSASGMDGVTLIDYVIFDEQTVDISYGCYPDTSDNLIFLVSPTPGTENTTGYLGSVIEPEFSHQHGFCSEPFSVVITTETEGAMIYYTLDGSEPYTAEIGERLPTDIPYTDPILIDKTTCLRAKAVKEGWKSSEAIACSYFFGDDVIQQPVHPEGFPDRWGSRNADYEMDPDIVYNTRYHDNLKNTLTSIPTMSIVMNKDDMFGIEGVYSNPHEEKEKPASVELIYPDDTQDGFQINCGIKIIGGASRSMSSKNSFRLLFKGIYGPTKLRFPLFGPDAASEFNTIVLRSSFNDGYGWSGARFYEQYTRDEFIRTLQRDMVHVSPNSILVHLYINGLYWGLYFPCERPDASFSASYYGGEEEDWDTFSHRGITLSEGNDSALHQMTTLCQQAS